MDKSDVHNTAKITPFDINGFYFLTTFFSSICGKNEIYLYIIATVMH